MDKALLLDTHVWIWLMNDGPQEIQAAALSRIEDSRTPLYVAAISAWEVAMLEAKGRIRLPVDCLEWIHRALNAPRLSLLALTPGIAVASTRLPGDVHGDPADRILLATAREHNLVLVTRDERLLAYGTTGYVTTLPA
jgi:PIN domain nuclease of toxin-antitoxin system